jgi:hypothetical protein
VVLAVVRVMIVRGMIVRGMIVRGMIDGSSPSGTLERSRWHEYDNHSARVDFS